MFQRMLQASQAVLLHPSVATFEEYEQDDFGGATVYVLVGAVLSAILGAIAYAIRGPSQAQLDAAADVSTTSSLAAVVGGNIVGALIGFLIYSVFVYALGRAFGGTGTLGQLAYDISLFWAPMAVVRALVDVVAIGPLAILTGIVGVALAIYNFYLTYLGVQSGMNLPSNKAIIIVLIPWMLFVLLVCVLIFALGALIGISQQQ
ncbi:MAG TPA: Yip1 family protein [Roseiflexaceae bacterium]|nr:Yip1 family protein [Roseiflexaceae bacterium]